MDTNGSNGHPRPQPPAEDYFSDSSTCFSHFDVDRDKALNYTEFVALCAALFRNTATGTSYFVEEPILRRLFGIFNISGSGLIDPTGFERCWNEWITKILHPVSALVVIDVQNDFVDGSLALRNTPLGEDGAEVIEPINQLTSETSGIKWTHIFFAQDWHPADHISFVDNASLRPLHSSSPLKDSSQAKVLDVAVFEGKEDTGPIEQILWPAHCVQGSQGAQLHQKLHVPAGSTLVKKGTNPDIDSYSAFWDNGKLSQTKLHSELQARGVTDVYVCGLAYDLCVGFTVIHALDHGYRTVLVEDATRTLDLGRKKQRETEIHERHGVMVDSKAVKEIVEGVDRRPELGLKLAMEVQKIGKKVTAHGGSPDSKLANYHQCK